MENKVNKKGIKEKFSDLNQKYSSLLFEHDELVQKHTNLSIRTRSIEKEVSNQKDALVSAERLTDSLHSSILGAADRSSKRLAELQYTLQERNDELELYLIEKQALIKANSHSFTISDSQATQVPKLEAVIEAQKLLMVSLKDKAQILGSLFSNHVKQIGQLLLEVVAERDQLVKQLHVERVSREAIELLYGNAKETTNRALEDQDILIRSLRQSWTEAEMEMTRLKELAITRKAEEEKLGSLQPPRVARGLSAEQRKEGDGNSLGEANLMRRILGGKVNEEKLFPLLEVLTEYQNQKQELEEYKVLLEERNKEMTELEELRKKYEEATSKKHHSFSFSDLGYNRSNIGLGNTGRFLKGMEENIELSGTQGDDSNWKALVDSLAKRIKELKKALLNREENISLLLAVQMEARKKIYELDPEFNHESLIVKNPKVSANLLKKRQTNELCTEVSELYRRIRKMEKQMSRTSDGATFKGETKGLIDHSVDNKKKDLTKSIISSAEAYRTMQIETGGLRKTNESLQGSIKEQKSGASGSGSLMVEEKPSFGKIGIIGGPETKGQDLQSTQKESKMQSNIGIDYSDTKIVEELLRTNETETQDDLFYKREALNFRKKLNDSECQALTFERQLKNALDEKEKLEKIVQTYESILNEDNFEANEERKVSVQAVEQKVNELMDKFEELLHATSNSGTKMANEALKWRNLLTETIESKDSLFSLIKTTLVKLREVKAEANRRLKGVQEERDHYKSESSALAELLRINTEEHLIRKEGLELQLETVRVVNSCLSGRINTLNNVVEQYYGRIQELLIERDKQNKNEELQKIKMVLEEENKELQAIKETYAFKTDRLENLEKEFDSVFKMRVGETEKLQEALKAQFEEMKGSNEKKFEELTRKRDEIIEEVHEKFVKEKQDKEEMAKIVGGLKVEMEKSAETLQKEMERKKEALIAIETLKQEGSKMVKERNSMVLGMSLRETSIDFARKMGMAQAESIKNTSEAAVQQKERLREKCQELESELSKIRGDFSLLETQHKEGMGRLSEECERLKSLKSDAETNLKRLKKDRDVAEMRAHELEKAKTELEEKLKRLEERKGEPMQEEPTGSFDVLLAQKSSPKDIVFEEEQGTVEEMQEEKEGEANIEEEKETNE